MANAKEQLKQVNAAIAKLKAQKGVAQYIKLAKMQARLKGKVTGTPTTKETPTKKPGQKMARNLDKTSVVKKVAGKAKSSKGPDDIFAAMRAAVLAKVKTLGIPQRKKLYNAFLKWFDYKSEMADDEFKFDKRLVDELMDADPMLAEGGLSDFLTKQKIISKKMLDAFDD